MAIKVANNQSLTAITALPSAVSGGAMTLLETQTASSSSTLSFTSDIDDTYDEYVFKFYDIHPATDGAEFQFQASTDSGSNYNTTVTSTHFDAYQEENAGSPTLSYMTGFDQAQGTGFETIARDIGSDNDQAASGYLHIFNPSDTTFVKHFISKFNFSGNNDFTGNSFHAGYFNTTSAIDAVQFKMSADAIDAGDICLYGIN